jgi:hypothetical protein
MKNKKKIDINELGTKVCKLSSFLVADCNITHSFTSAYHVLDLIYGRQQ